MRSTLPLLLVLAACTRPPAPSPDPRFEWFELAATDSVALPAPGTFRNPILPGFHPDPSVVRVGEDYWLVTSSFAWFPGLPIFHSRDLVHWKPVGHALDRPEQVSFDSLRVSEGVFAPTLRYHDGTFYLVVTLVGAGGNVVLTASDPRGPWSRPVPLPSVDGIDPDLFFDDDGRAWIAHNGPPPAEPEWDGHRALWIQEFDVDSLRMIGPRTLIVDGGVDPATNPVWIEGPHLIKRDGRYFLIAAEGGTGENHSQVVFAGPSPTGPFTPGEDNPILTQRDLAPGRTDAVTSTGHADFVQTPSGEWWAVFLGCRPYDADHLLYATGRETFLLPVDWSGEWPRILARGTPVPLEVPSPFGATGPVRGPVLDTFDSSELSPEWVRLRSTTRSHARLDDGDLVLTARPDSLGGLGRPALLARRLEHANASASVSMRYRPGQSGDRAGLVAMQQDDSWFFLAVGNGPGGTGIALERRSNGTSAIVASRALPLDADQPIVLRFELSGARARFSYRVNGDEWATLADDVDATLLTTRRSGGFTGTMVGVYAQTGSGAPAILPTGTGPAQGG